MTHPEFVQRHTLTIERDEFSAPFIPPGRRSQVLGGRDWRLWFCPSTGIRTSWKMVRPGLVRSGMELMANDLHGGELFFERSSEEQLNLLCATEGVKIRKMDKSWGVIRTPDCRCNGTIRE